MIQPVSALSPRAGFRGKDGAYGLATKGFSGNSKIALLNAGGVSAAVGGLTTAIARSYTTNWTHAGVLGLCGAFLAMFFMTPQIIEKAGYGLVSHKNEAKTLAKEDSQKLSVAIKEYIRPMRKNVHFKKQA